jgi:hypothetical protein
VQCGFGKRREYATRAVINGAYRDGDEKSRRYTVVKMPEGLELQWEKGKIGPGEGTSMEEVVGSHIPMAQHRAMRGRLLAGKELVSQAWKKREERSVQVKNIDDSNVLDDNSIIET